MPRPYMRQLPTPMEREVPYIEARVNGGLVTQVDSADIQNNEFAQMKNMYSRDDKIGRRYGTSIYSPAKPNANAILLIDTIKEYTGTVKIMRFSTSTVHKMDFGGAVWTAITGPAFTADDTYRIKMVRLANRTFFTDGKTNIKEINLTANTYANAGNAPKAAFIAGFFNRLVAANYTAVGAENPVQIGWSGDTNFSEWDPLVDYSSGFTYLAESPSDYSDFIVGLVPLANSMIILKEKSVWLATKQPSASNPFNFFTVVPGVGCDCPQSIQKITNGCVWYDSRIGTVFLYTVGMTEPENIGFKIARTFLTDILDPNHCTSAYDPTNDEYSLVLAPYGAPSWPCAGTAKIWRYNFRNKSWSYDELADVTSIDYIESVNVRKRIYGKYQGDLLVDDYTLYLPATLDSDNTLAYTSTLVSKTFELPKEDEYIQKLRIEYIPRLAGAFTISYSKDNGATWIVYKTVTFVAGDVGLRKLAIFNKNLKARQYTWKLSGTTGLYDIIQFAITTFSGAPSKS